MLYRVSIEEIYTFEGFYTDHQLLYHQSFYIFHAHLRNSYYSAILSASLQRGLHTHKENDPTSPFMFKYFKLTRFKLQSTSSPSISLFSRSFPSLFPLLIPSSSSSLKIDSNPSSSFTFFPSSHFPNLL